MLLWFCADVCGRWLVHMKIQTSCNGFYGDVYKGYRTSHNECLCIFCGGSCSAEKSKIARRCGEKPIYKWKYIKNLRSEALFVLAMSKNRTPLWREAHSQVKMYKAGQLRNAFEVLMRKNCTRLWREAHSPVKMLKSDGVGPLFEHRMSKNCKSKCWKKWGSGSTFWRSAVEKLHAAVARSTCVCENVENTSAADSILKFWCPNNARGCGEKHIYKSKCTKNTAQSHHFLKFWCGCCESITCVSASQPASQPATQPPSQPASQGNWSVDPLAKQSINQSASLWLATTNLSYRFPILKLLVSLFTSTVHIFTTESKGALALDSIPASVHTHTHTFGFRGFRVSGWAHDSIPDS